MIKLNGTNGVFEIDMDSVYYWIQSGNSLIFFTNLNAASTVDFSNANEMISAASKIWNETHFKNATIPSNSSSVFNINVSKLKSHSVSTTTITLNFFEYSVGLVCVNATEATLHNNYLANIFYSVNIEKNWIGKTFFRVNPNYTNDITNRLYNTIQAAITAASSGNVVIVEKGDYEEFIILKNGVDLFFEEETKHYVPSTGNSISDSGGAVTCKILGKGKFYNLYSGNAGLKINNASTVYFEFDTIEKYGDDTVGAAYGFGIYGSNGTIYLKGNTINGIGSTGRCTDYDGTVVTADIDVLNLISKNDVIAFPANDAGSDTNFIYRNAYCETFNNNSSGGYGMFYFDSSGAAYTIILMNLRIKNFGSCDIFYFYNTHTAIRLWNVFNEGIESTLYSMFGFDPETVTFYTNCYSTKGVNANITSAGIGSHSIDSTFRILR